MNKNITALVFTFNEERRLPYVHKNLKDFCEIIVLDGGSTDGTLDYCKSQNIKFISRPHEASPEMRLRNQPLLYDHSPTEYVLHVYCAHFFPTELLDRFSRVANENKISAVYHDVVIYRYGTIVHKPTVRRIASACVFYKKTVISPENAKIHDELAIQFDANSMIRLDGRDELSLHLFQDEDCRSYTLKTIEYATREAKERFLSDTRVGFFGLFFKPVYKFIYGYFRTGAFCRGVPGLIYSILNLVYDFQINIILWEMCHDLNLRGVHRENALTRLKLITEGSKHKYS